MAVTKCSICVGFALAHVLHLFSRPILLAANTPPLVDGANHRFQPKRRINDSAKAGNEVCRGNSVLGAYTASHALGFLGRASLPTKAHSWDDLIGRLKAHRQSCDDVRCPSAPAWRDDDGCSCTITADGMADCKGHLPGEFVADFKARPRLRRRIATQGLSSGKKSGLICPPDLVEPLNIPGVEPIEEWPGIKVFIEALKLISRNEGVHSLCKRADNPQPLRREFLRLVDGKNRERRMYPFLDVGALQKLPADVADLIELLHVRKRGNAVLPAAHDVVGERVDRHARGAPPRLSRLGKTLFQATAGAVHKC